MSAIQNPIAPIEVLKERAMGFFSKQKIKPDATQVVGVDVGRFHLLVAAVEKKQDKFEITHFRVEPRPANPEEVSERLKAIFKEEGLNQKSVRTALKSDGMVIRILNFPSMKKNEMASMLQYEVEKYIPFRASEVILDFQILGESVEKGDVKTMEILLVVVKQSEVHQLLSFFQKADLGVELIDVAAFAISNLLELITPDPKRNPLAFLDMGLESSIFGILAHGKPTFIRDISFGGGDIIKFLSRKLGIDPDSVMLHQKNPASVPGNYNEVVEQALTGLLSELKLSLSYYLDHVKAAEPVKSLYIVGGGFRFLSDLGVIEREIRIPTQRPDIFSNISIHPNLDATLLKKNEDLIPSALGLCLR